MFKFVWNRLRKADDGLDAAVRTAIVDDHLSAILRLVVENPGISGEKLAERAGLGQGVAGHCLERLIVDRLVEKDAGAGYSVPESARPAVIRYLPLHYQCPGLKRG